MSSATVFSTDYRTAAADVLGTVDTLLASFSELLHEGTKFTRFPTDYTPTLLRGLEDKLVQAISHVRTMRNAHARACQLPPEVIDCIFAAASAPMPNFMPESPTKQTSNVGRPNDWCILSGVCRYWRAVSLEFSSRWNNIDLGDESRSPSSNMALAELCYRRSGGAALDLHLWTRHLPRFIQTGHPADAARLRSVHLYGFPFDSNHLSGLFPHQAPLLENLTIQPTASIRSIIDTPVLPTLFAGYTPLLRRLTLKFFSSWPGNDFKNLTHLCLQYTVHRSPYPTSRFMDFLAASPSLEVLVLINSGPTEDDSLQSPARHVALPRLRHLVFEDCSQSCVKRVLPHLILPQTFSIRISLAANGKQERGSTLLSVCSHMENLSRVTRIRLESQMATGKQRLRITGTGASAVDLFPGPDIHEMSQNQCMAAAMQFLSACNVRELWLGKDNTIVREFRWARLFSTMPRLKTLVLGPWSEASTDDSGEYLAALCTADENLGRTLPCPELEELVILGRLGESKWFSERIRVFLKTRARLGFPVHSVILVEERHRVPLGPVELSFKLDAISLGLVVDNSASHIVEKYPVMEGLMEIQAPLRGVEVVEY